MSLDERRIALLSPLQHAFDNCHVFTLVRRECLRFHIHDSRISIEESELNQITHSTIRKERKMPRLKLDLMNNRLEIPSSNQVYNSLEDINLPVDNGNAGLVKRGTLVKMAPNIIEKRVNQRIQVSRTLPVSRAYTKLDRRGKVIELQHRHPIEDSKYGLTLQLPSLNSSKKSPNDKNHAGRDVNESQPLSSVASSSRPFSPIGDGIEGIGEGNFSFTSSFASNTTGLDQLMQSQLSIQHPPSPTESILSRDGLLRAALKSASKKPGEGSLDSLSNDSMESQQSLSNKEKEKDEIDLFEESIQWDALSPPEKEKMKRRIKWKREQKKERKIKRKRKRRELSSNIR